MDAVTRAAVEEFYQLQTHRSKESESAADAQVREELEYASKLRKFELLDEVFEGFLATNIHRGKHFTFEELLTVQHDKKLYLRFTHLEVPYLATVVRVTGADADCINIKLCNDGFYYTAKKGGAVRRHKLDEWVRLEADRYQPYMTCTLNTVRSLYGEMVAYYNSRHQRIDMEFFPKQPTKVPNMIITFEPGYPDEDHLQPTDLIH